ncbi:MAG: hypothetical protein A2Y54_08455 [Chloroflexi bacterium RBG_16_51_16]|nr:MAG: hypothetical protein A2Y54_08455 [Chloroflexi bacterium RBG_16_51_16]
MRKKLFIVPLIIAALVLAGCGPATISSTGGQPDRTLNVTGLGQVDITPDIAYIYIGIHTEGASASDAVKSNNTQTEVLIKALTDSGVDAKDIRTTNFGIWPSTQYGPDGQALGTVYMVDNTVYVTVRELDGLGDLLDSAIEAGANSINSIQFDLADKTEALKEARADAVKNASEQAAELADAAGVKLGEIVNVTYFDSQPYPYSVGKGGGGGGAGIEAAVPIQPGQLSIAANVSLTYEIK